MIVSKESSVTLEDSLLIVHLERRKAKEKVIEPKYKCKTCMKM